MPSLDTPTAENASATTEGIRAFDKAHVVMLIQEGLGDREVGRPCSAPSATTIGNEARTTATTAITSTQKAGLISAGST